MKVMVLAQPFDPKTGKPLGHAREEEINTDTNVLFTGCKTLAEIHEKYEIFWNELPTVQTELVLVQSMRLLASPSQISGRMK